MDCCENYAKVLLIENYRDIFEYSFLKPSNPEFLDSNTFEFSVPLYFFKITLLLEFFRSSLVEEITKHELYFHVELSRIFRFLC